MPSINYALETKKYGDFNCLGEDLTRRIFLLQIGGPASIDTLEDACGESLRDVKFLHSKKVIIGGKSVRIAHWYYVNKTYKLNVNFLFFINP